MITLGPNLNEERLKTLGLDLTIFTPEDDNEIIEKLAADIFPLLKGKTVHQIEEALYLIRNAIKKCSTLK